MMLDAAGLIEKHRSKGALIDTNLLLIYLVGKTNRRRIRDFKPCDVFEIEDLERLEELVEYLGKLFTTPHVMTEVSNLAKLRGKELSAFRQLYKLLVEQMDEFYDESRSVVVDAAFMPLGLTDAAIALLQRRNLLVLTVDLDLWMTLQRRGVDAVNFNHLRASNWHREPGQRRH
jgi:predicted nucleic acid-binding protein